MGRFLVGGGCSGIPVDLHKNESHWIVCLLNDVEAGDPRLADAPAGVFDGGGFEGLDVVRLYMDMDVGDKHDGLYSPTSISRPNDPVEALYIAGAAGHAEADRLDGCHGPASMTTR